MLAGCCIKRLSIKDVRSQGVGGGGGEVFLVRTFFGQEGRKFFQMRTFIIFNTKNSRFFEIYVVSARTRGKEVEPVRTFFGQGDQFFAILFRRLLWTAPTLLKFWVKLLG